MSLAYRQRCFVLVLALLFAGVGCSEVVEPPADGDVPDDDDSAVGDDDSAAGDDDSAAGDDDSAGEEPVDSDGDGFDERVDCDDEDPQVYPEADEFCDGFDNDCDGEIDEDDASDATTWYDDEDGDGYGDDASAHSSCMGAPGDSVHGGDCDDDDPAFHPGAAESDCTDPQDYNCDGATGYVDLDGDGAPACEDCNDADAAIHDAGTEVCDGVDNDCDGAIDESGAGGESTWYLDADGDGYGRLAFPVVACDAPPSYVGLSTDCDDLDPASYPGGTEVCDEADNNCDGVVDEGVTQSWFVDADGDGFGDPAATITACALPPGASSNDQDCDDSNPAAWPGFIELCDGADNDCDGVIDDNPVDATFWYLDADGDGAGNPLTGVQACVGPAGTVGNNQDCDDSDGANYPANAEICDFADNNCDGQIDEGSAAPTSWYDDIDQDGAGDPTTAQLSCTAVTGSVTNGDDCDDADGGNFPGNSELCDGADGDCDGVPDNGFDTDGDGVTTCGLDATVGTADDDCDDGNAAVYPLAADTYGDGVDGDCDGMDCAGLRFDASSYFVICPQNSNWQDARSLCQGAGYGDLASVRSSAEQDWLKALAAAANFPDPEAPWIGYNDLANEGNWQWSDGWTGSYTAWNPGEPNNVSDEDCTQLYWGPGDTTGNWNDHQCQLAENWTGFVCQWRE
jgi:hypothetical protein